MNASSADGVDDLVERAHAAIDADDLKEAGALVAELTKALPGDDGRALHLRALFSWAEGDIEEAGELIAQAVEAMPGEPRVAFDCAELMLGASGDLDLAESGLRVALDGGKLSDDDTDQAKVLLAQVCLEQVDVDAEEALELLASASDKAKSDAYWISTQAGALLELGRGDEAIELWERAVADPEAAGDPDVHYQLGICYALTGRDEQAVAAMTRVVELDTEADEYDAIDSDESHGLRVCLEEVLEGIPEPLLKRIAAAPIEIQTRPKPAQIAAGVDPRAFVAFDGTAEDQDLRAVVVMRNVLLTELEDEEQLPEALISGLIDEFRRFFGVEELAVASV